ncbi:unnamed protein product [Lota lota]
MESLDPPKNIANVGTTRRRLSSILKAPRTSVDFADQEDVETPVKVAMLVEKRNSRRVSFAPATDVLLFSKEEKNGSPVQGPLQDLMLLMWSFSQSKRYILDMENLLYAPLQTSQQRKEVFMVSNDAEDLYGEKTVMFSADDAAMDVTQSHTVIITKDSEPDQDGEMRSTCANMDFLFSMDREKPEPCILPKITSSSVHRFDPELEKTLASLSKQTVPKDNSMLHNVEQNAPMRPHDKENQAPTFMTTRRENLPQKTVKIGESSNRGVVPSEDTQEMEMTDVFTGHIVENATAADSLQGLFPTLDLYRRSEHREPVKRDGRQQCFEALNCSFSNPNDKPMTKISVADLRKFRLGVPSLKMGNSLSFNLTQTCPLPENKLISQNKNVQHVLRLKEYANRNSSESDDMDMARSQTFAIDSRIRPAVTTLTKQQEISRPSITTPCKTSADYEHDTDFTRCQTGVMEARNLDLGKPSYTVNAGGSVRIMADNQWDRALNQGKIAIDNLEIHEMEITQSQTAAIDSLHGVKPLQMSQDIVKPSTKWNNPSGNDDMELTTCVTGVFETKDVDVTAKPGSMTFMSAFTQNTSQNEFSGEMTKIHSNTSLLSEDAMDGLTSRREGFERYNCESDDMEMTKSQNVAFDTKKLNSVHPLENKKRKSLAFLTTIDHRSQPSDLSMPGMYFGSCFSKAESAVDTDMGLTRSQTRLIEVKPEIYQPEDTTAMEREGSEQYNCEPDNMEITKSQTVIIDDENLNAVNPLANKGRKSLAFVATCPKVDNVPEDGYCKDKIQTNIEADKEMEFTRDQTRLIETKHLTFVKPSLKISSGKSFPTLDSNTHLPISMNAVENTKTSHNVTNIFPEANQGNDSHALCSEDMELTRGQTVPLNCESTGISNIQFHRARKSLTLLKEKSSGMDVNVFHMISSESQNPNEMDITRSHTVAIQLEDVHSPDDSSLNNSQVTGPPEGLSSNQSGSAGKLGVDLNSRSHGLTNLGQSMFQNGTIPIQLNQEATTLSTSMLSLDGKVSDLTDQLDAFQNEVKSIPLSVDKNCPGNTNAFGASSESAAMQSKNGSDLRQENGSLSCGLESAPCIKAAVDKTSSTKSRQMILVDLQFKLRRMCHLPNEPTEKFAVDYCDAPLSQPKSASDGISGKTQLLTAPQHNQTSWVSSADPNKVSSSCRTSVEENGNEVITHQLSSSMIDDIVDEVLPNISSDEDLSMVTENPQSTNEEDSSLHEREVQGASEEEVWELSPGHPCDSLGKRPSPVDGKDTIATEKRSRISSNNIEMVEKGKCIGTFRLAPAVMTQAIDVSNSTKTAHLRSETTFESTLKQSLFESQLEDNTNDFQKNIDDERITVLEFFQLLNIDFVIHNPRQSILPGKLTSHLGHTPEDLLKNRHINHPKQRVYEVEHKNLAEKVEGLKARMKDQARLLHSVNKPLWEELKCFSEDELKEFGSKMKERSNFFRKRSKAQSHEMKEALYSNLQQAILEEQQKLRGKMEEADGMLKSLDNCIQELETELAAVEGNGLDGSKPTLKSSLLGLENVTMELADKERQMCEMEMQKKCNMDQVKRLQTEVQDLNKHIIMLHRVNEWKVAEKRANCDVYSFLYESMHLEVVFDTGEGPDEVNERNILDINFKLELDEEKSECHARLVHALLSEFTKGRSDWVEQYPSNRYVPKLLHDVSLVVCRCRLLGEEVRLLKTLGALRFNILDIRCLDMRVHFVFSSLEAMAKFELSLAVTMAYPCCPLQLQDFKNHIGSTTGHRIEEIVSTISPGKNYLTKTIKAIHAAVLS